MHLKSCCHLLIPIIILTNMLLPYRLLSNELSRNDCMNTYLQYRRSLIKTEKNTQRINFLSSCFRADIIPRFLRFRIPNNGTFDQKSVFEFQKGLLRKELYRAKQDQLTLQNKLCEKRKEIQTRINERLLPSVALYSRQSAREARKDVKNIHRKKLLALSEEQERPLFNVKNTVILHELDEEPPRYVIDTLSLGPKNSVLERFNPHDILAEIDGLLNDCKQNNVTEEVISDINIKTINYIKKCKKQKASKHIQATKRYLKDRNLLAVPFDKGVGICLMKKEAYEEKLLAILQLEQFEKIVDTRKNAKHAIFKEEERVVGVLKELKNQGKIDEVTFERMLPIKGLHSQPARLYGLAKVHKTGIPTRPVLSMPGSIYHPIAKIVTEWLNVVPECKINTSTKKVADSLKEIELEEDEVMVSFDVSSLYTNVPVQEAINVCSDLLFNGDHELPPVDKETFKTLLELCTCNVVMKTHDGFYRQTDGLAMGSPPAPLMANGWLAKYDPRIKENSKLYARYMDDILKDMKRDKVQQKLAEINSYHPSLKFTIEEENEQSALPFLDMLIYRTGTSLHSTWYNKPTDTGLVMNYHALAPTKYKRSVVAGFVYRIHRACSSWKNFHSSLSKAKKVLEQNQYPPNFYEPIIEKAIEKILFPADPENGNHNGNTPEQADTTPKKLIFIEYRGKVTDNYCRALRKINAPCQPVLTLRKLKTIMPSLKPAIDKQVRSHIVYRITCPRCKSCYIGASTRCLGVRFGEHKGPSKPVGKHLRKCNALQYVSLESVEVLASTTRSERYLFTLEALWQKEERPKINTKDEFKRHELTIMW